MNQLLLSLFLDLLIILVLNLNFLETSKQINMQHSQYNEHIAFTIIYISGIIVLFFQYKIKNNTCYFVYQTFFSILNNFSLYRIISIQEDYVYSYQINLLQSSGVKFRFFIPLIICAQTHQFRKSFQISILHAPFLCLIAYEYFKDNFYICSVFIIIIINVIISEVKLRRFIHVAENIKTLKEQNSIIKIFKQKLNNPILIVKYQKKQFQVLFTNQKFEEKYSKLEDQIKLQELQEICEQKNIQNKGINVLQKQMSDNEKMKLDSVNFEIQQEQQNFFVHSPNLVLQQKLFKISKIVFRGSLCSFENEDSKNHQIINEEDFFLKNLNDYRITCCEFNEEKFVLFQDEENEENQLNISQNNKILIKKDKDKDLVLATVSHDLKTTLNGILIIVDYLMEKITNQNLNENLNILKKNGQMMLFMINDILDYTRLMDNKLKVNPIFLNLDNLLKEVIDLFALQAEQKNIKILLFNEGVKHLKMFSDPNRIKQILLNLISNSLKFTKSGQISIIVEKEQQSLFTNSENLLRLTVRDTGVGVPDEIKPNLFQMYQTYDHDGGSNKNGTGLGLFICKNLIEVLGPLGTVELMSEKGQGTVVTFCLYIHIAADQQSHLMSRISRVSISVMKNMSEDINNEINYFEISNIREKQLTFSSIGIRSKPQTSRDDKNNVEAEDEKFSKNKNIDKLKKSYTSLNQNNLISNQTIQNHLDTNPLSPCTVSQNQNKTSSAHNLMKDYQQNQSLVQIGKINDNHIRILVVDDQVFNVRALKLLLKKYENLDVKEAYDSEQAINIVIENFNQGNPIHLVLMDLNMPLKDGFETAKILVGKVRNNTQQINQVKQKMIPPLILIALSGSDDEKDKLRCEKIGFNAFIAKPIKKSEINSLFQKFSLLPILRQSSLD